MRVVLLLVVTCLSCVVANAQVQVNSVQREGWQHNRERQSYVDGLRNLPDDIHWRVINDHVRFSRYSIVASGQKNDWSRVLNFSKPWREQGSANQAGRVLTTFLDPDSQRLWVAGAGGTIWEGSLDGFSWRCLNDKIRIVSPRMITRVVSPSGEARLIVVSSEPRVFSLSNKDSAWTLSSGMEEFQRWGGIVKAVGCNRAGRLEILLLGYEWNYGTDWKAVTTLWRSVDSARSFQRLFWLPDSRTRSMWSDGMENALVVNSDTVYSVDATGSRAVLSMQPDWRSKSIVLAGSSATNLIAAVADTMTAFYYSDVGGVDWYDVGTSGEKAFDIHSLGTSLLNPKTWYFGGVNAYRSSDMFTWSRINGWAEYYSDPVNKLHADIPGFSSYLLPDGKEVTLVCTDGGLYKSYDNLKSVQNISTHGLNVSQYYSVYTSRDNTNIIYAGSQDQGFQISNISSDTARPFRQTISGDYAHIVSADDGHTLWCVYPGFMMYIPDAEKSWRPLALTFPHKGHMWLPPLAAIPSAPDTVLLGGGSLSKGANLFRYWRDGDSIRNTELPFDFSEGVGNVRISGVKVSPANPNYWFVTTTNRVFFRSTDRGATWSKTVIDISGHYFHGIAIAPSPYDPNVIYLAGSGYTTAAMFHSTDGGVSFNPVPGLPPCMVIGLAVNRDASIIYAASDAGAYSYNVKDKTWTDLTALGGPDQIYWSVDWIDQLKIARFGTYGRGIWDFIPDNVPTDVNVTMPTEDIVSIEAVVLPDGPGVRISNSSDRIYSLHFYDLQGRLLESVQGRGQVEPVIITPPNGTTMAVFVAGNTVRACIVPRR